MLYRLVLFNFLPASLFTSVKNSHCASTMLPAGQARLWIHPLYVRVCMSVYLFFHLNCGSVPSYCVMKCLYASQQQVSLLMIFFYHDVHDHLYILKVGGSMTLCVAKHVVSWFCSRPQVSTCLTARFSLTTSPQQLPPVAMHSLYGFYAVSTHGGQRAVFYECSDY